MTGRSSMELRARSRVGRISTAASGRAVLGAALVVAAVLALYVGWVRATSTGALRVIVAARALDPGHTLTADDLRVAELRASDAPMRGVFSDPAPLIGATTLGPIGEGELVQAASLVKKAGGPDTLEVGISLDRAAAVGGRLRAGDLVDVYETDRASARDRPSAILLATGVPVVWIHGAELGASSAVDLVVAVPDRGTAALVVAASANEQVALVRSTGAPAAQPGSAPSDPDPRVEPAAPAVPAPGGDRRSDAAGST
jgi:Flp pilus assembly protein CpaB